MFNCNSIMYYFTDEFFEGNISAEDAAKQIDAEVENYLAR